MLVTVLAIERVETKSISLADDTFVTKLFASDKLDLVDEKSQETDLGVDCDETDVGVDCEALIFETNFLRRTVVELPESVSWPLPFFMDNISFEF